MKPLWQSKTLWANLAMAALAFFPAIQGKLDSEMIAVGMGVVNIILRLVTNKGVSVSSG